ncbi:MAG: hypothetical protein NTU89_00835 [Candidatus Dependentiae bacterium]|nr:hypothetical protein [Candidatus Dependentiae bacterium]
MGRKTIQLIFCFAILAIIHMPLQAVNSTKDNDFDNQQSVSLFPTQYIYPISNLDYDYLLIMRQKSYDDLELWMWNKNSKKAYRELASIYLPYCVRLLPSKTAFSFIDHGRVRVKSFQKRTPRIIDIDPTIHAISSLKWISEEQFYLKWISEEQFYFVGKQKDYFSIFLCDVSDRDVQLFNLHDKEPIDYLYPCKINNSLFYITKDQSFNYSFCRTVWSPQISDQSHSVFTRQKEILLSSECPICFLSMEDENNGFALKYDNQSNDDKNFHLSCCALNLIRGSWSLEKLFDFKLPLRLLTGTDKTRLYESIDPFLPSYSKNYIYFTTYDELLECCKVFRYNKQLKTIEGVEGQTRSIGTFNHIFAPLVVDNNNVYFGFAQNTRSNNSTLQIDETSGSITCFLPETIINGEK